MKYIVIFLIVLLSGCKAEVKSEKQSNTDKERRNLSEQFQSYWFDGKAELTSYELEFYQYGEKRKGTSMLIFVTEDFLKDAQVKANSPSENTVTVMKLNSTKKFNTGIYPYSIMQSTFLPLEHHEPVLKLVSSIQEWCGQTYAQLNHRSNFELKTHSYFEGEADANFDIEPTTSENELWIQLRIDPTEMKLGDQNLLPDFSYLQLNHKEFKSYKATIEQNITDVIVTKISYKDLGRILTIYQDNNFPYAIEKWEEAQVTSTDTMISTAKKMKTLKTKYWQKNSNKYLHLRDSLSL